MPQAAKDLPTWDLRDLYASPDDPAIQADLKKATEDAEAFARQYQGTLAGLDGKGFGAAIAAYEKISERLGGIISYAQLVFAANTTDPEVGRFYQTMSERVTDISSETLFFELEINRIEDAVLERQLEEPSVARYRPWLETVRDFRPYQLAGVNGVV